MPRRRWRARERREGLSEATIALLTTRAMPLAGAPEVVDLRFYRLKHPDPGRDLMRIWRAHGGAITAAWIRENPGTRPWAWWACDAVEPRRCVAGAELLLPVRAPGDWTWVWRQDFGVPALAQCRPRGYVGLPAVESQAAYLDRLGLLGAEERAALPADAFEPEEINPFLIDAAEIDRLLAPRGGAA
jgi:hypothetical protein